MSNITDNNYKHTDSVSVIIPVFNEEKRVEGLVDSLIKQDYPSSLLEYVFVDGGSKDNTKELVAKCCEQRGLKYIILDNPRRTAPNAINIGIENSTGDIIVLLSAHSEYFNDYISNGVRHLKESDAVNVGGTLITVGKGFIGNCISKVLSSWFGVGGSDFRIVNETKYVETVPFGTFYRTLIDEIGGFNPELPRSEDNEFNYRIRKNGGKILMVSDMQITYYCRESLSELLTMGLANGDGVGYTLIVYPGVMRIRHLIPLAFTLSLIILPLLILLTGWRWIPILFILELLAYLLLDVVFSLKTKQSIAGKIVAMAFFPLFHISYGLGTIKGLVKGLKKKIRKKNESN